MLLSWPLRYERTDQNRLLPQRKNRYEARGPRPRRTRSYRGRMDVLGEPAAYPWAIDHPTIGKSERGRRVHCHWLSPCQGGSREGQASFSVTMDEE